MQICGYCSSIATSRGWESILEVKQRHSTCLKMATTKNAARAENGVRTFVNFSVVLWKKRTLLGLRRQRELKNHPSSFYVNVSDNCSCNSSLTICRPYHATFQNDIGESLYNWAQKKDCSLCRCLVERSLFIQRNLRCNILMVVIIQFSFKKPLLLMFQGSKKSTGISFEVKYFLL